MIPSVETVCSELEYWKSVSSELQDVINKAEDILRRKESSKKDVGTWSYKKYYHPSDDAYFACDNHRCFLTTKSGYRCSPSHIKLCESCFVDREKLIPRIKKYEREDDEEKVQRATIKTEWFSFKAKRYRISIPRCQTFTNCPYKDIEDPNKTWYALDGTNLHIVFCESCWNDMHKTQDFDSRITNIVKKLYLLS